MKVTLDLFLSHKWKTNFMKAADVFEKKKFLYEYVCLDCTLSEDNTLFDVCDNVAKKINEEGEYLTLFIGLRSIDGIPSKGDNHYLLPEVQTISDGRNWVTFHSALKNLGYQVETDETMTVTKVFT